MNKNMFRILTLAAFSAYWAHTAVAQNPATSVTVEARLKAMSKTPTLKDLSTYKESLIACHWEVSKVTGGALKDKEIVVYHWSYLDSKFQEGATAAPAGVFLCF